MYGVQREVVVVRRKKRKRNREMQTRRNNRMKLTIKYKRTQWEYVRKKKKKEREQEHQKIQNKILKKTEKSFFWRPDYRQKQHVRHQYCRCDIQPVPS